MYLSLKLSPARLLAFVCAVVCAILVQDAWRTSKAEPPIVLAADFDRAAYLKDIGLEVDPEPIWVKSFTLTDRPDEALSSYVSVLEKQGFRPLDYAGKELTVYCYRSVSDPTIYGRILLCGDALVGADRFTAKADGQLSEPILK